MLNLETGERLVYTVLDTEDGRSLWIFLSDDYLVVVVKSGYEGTPFCLVDIV